MQPNNSPIGPNLPGQTPSAPRNTAQQAAANEAAVNIVRGQIDHIFNQTNSAQPTQQSPTPQPQARPRLPIQPRPRPQTPSRVVSAPQTPPPAQVAEIQPQAPAQTQMQTQPETPPAQTVVEPEKQPATSSQAPDSADDENPYDRTREHDQAKTRQTDHWKYYHSAWQDYYRQYYERYYIGEIYRMRQDTPTSNDDNALSRSLANSQETDNHEAFHDLRDDLLQNIRASAKKVHKSRHFMPIMAATLTFALLWFVGFGGNTIVIGGIKAYASPGTVDPANIIIAPTVDSQVSEEPRLIIPKINVDVPVVYETKPDRQSQLSAMEKGVAWFGIPGANSKPGQVGNTVLSGHSSNDLFDPGEFKFIFAKLEQLVEGDTFYVNYKGFRYVYSVTKREVVRPNQVNKLIYPTEGKRIVTLITCVPVGTAKDRLLVTAEQVNSNPADTDEGSAGTTTPPTTETKAMPGNSPSLLSRLFGSSN